MNKRFYLFALVLMVAFSSCTTKQTERLSKAQPWEIPLRLLGL